MEISCPPAAGKGSEGTYKGLLPGVNLLAAKKSTHSAEMNSLLGVSSIICMYSLASSHL